MLRLDHNLLQQVTPPELASCSQLTHVDLSHNHLMSVEGLGALHSLEELRLSSNQLIDLPNLASCSKVRGQLNADVHHPLKCCLLSSRY